MYQMVDANGAKEQMLLSNICISVMLENYHVAKLEIATFWSSKICFLVLLG